MKHDDVFGKIEPPPHGLALLRARIDSRDRVRNVRRLVPLAFAVAALVVLVVLASRRPDPVRAARHRADVAEVALGIAPMPAETVAIDEGDRATTALAEVRTENRDVSFYWVSSTKWKAQ